MISVGIELYLYKTIIMQEICSIIYHILSIILVFPI